MASLTHLDAPGAYPTTPLNEEPKRQTHHNKLHKREDPRGLSGNVSQNQHASDFISVNSGARADGASLVDQPAPSHHNPLHHAAFNETKDTPRSLGKDEQYRGHRFTDSGIDVGDAPIGRETAKPGVMTGAYSRVGTQDSSFAPASDYTYDQSSTSKPQSGIKSEYGADTSSSGTATNLVTPANTSTNSAKFDLDSNTTANRHIGQRDEAQGSVPVDSNTQRNEPYWGDLPYGVGVYNGVTGHGSNESTAHQKSTHGQIGTTADSGVHNGVIGHGSNESTSPQMSKYDSDTAMKDSAREQRVFPLSNDANTKSVASSNNTEKRERESHMKEMLAGAGATAAGGYAAHEYLNRGDNKRPEATDAKRTTNEKPNKSEQSKVAAAPSSHGHKNTESVADNKSEGKESLPHRLLAAIIPSKKTESRMDEEMPEKTENGKNEKKGNDKVTKDEKDKSDLGYFGAAAAAATGVGAYGLHEQAKRDSSKEHSSNPENKASSSAAPRTARESVRENTQPLSSNATNQTTSHEQSKSNVPVTGAMLGTANSTANQSPNTTHSGPSHSSIPSDGTSSNIVTGRRKATNHSTDPSQGGQYNILSSGTPSGINLEQAQSSTQGGRDEGQFLKLSATPPASQKHTATATERQAQQARDPRLQAAAMPMPMSGDSKKEMENKNEKSHGHVGAAAMGAGAMGVGAGTLMSGGHSSGRKVTHKCTKCGEENDISEYVMI